MKCYLLFSQRVSNWGGVGGVNMPLCICLARLHWLVSDAGDDKCGETAFVNQYNCITFAAQ